MARKTPTYLKLHVEDGDRDPRPRPTDLTPFVELGEAFQAVTGRQLTIGEPDKGDWSMAIDQSGDESVTGAQIVLKQDHTAGAEDDRVIQLAQSVGHLMTELQRARVALWEREAELATAIPVSMHAEDTRKLAERLECLLRGGADAVGCQAAALYLLDDATSHLKLRASWGLPASRFTEPPRSLRHSIADLEALIGHAVVLDDVSLLPHWNAPEGFASAVCVPVASASMLLGTMWIFCDKKRDFSDTETHLIEIVAGRIVAELEREILWREQLRTSDYRAQIHELSQWRRERMPTIEPPLDDWQLAGWTSSGRLVESGFYDWSILPDGTLSVALGWAEGDPVAAALASATVQTALRAHAEHGTSAAQIMRSVNESLINSSTGTTPVSLFYAGIDPATHQMNYATAGRTLGLIRRSPESMWLESSRPPLGITAEFPYDDSRVELQARDVLILSPDGAERDELLKAVRPHGRGSATQWITSLKRRIESRSEPAVDDALLVIRRR